MNTYASPEQLADWLGEQQPPANAESLLRSATVVVAAAAGRNPYTDTPIGNDVEPLRDATTAQAAAWVALGLTPATLGLDFAPVKRSQIGTGDVERDTTGQLDARKAAAEQLAPEAAKILQVAGLLLVALPVWTGGDDRLLDYGLAGTWPTVVPDPTTT